MPRLLRILVAFAALFVVLGDVQAIKRRPSREGVDHPEVVLVNGTAGHRACSHTGVLIAPTVVLTAAHCVKGFEAWEVIAPYAKGRPARATARMAKVHPDFQPGRIEDDLAVIILSEPLDVGAELPALHGGDLLPIETGLVVHGRVKNGTVSPNQLYEATVTLVGFPGNTNLYGGNPQSVEKGDSGGPLYVVGKPRVVVGIVSGILEFTRGNVPTDAYVPIGRKNREWIHQSIKRAEPRP